MCLLYTLSKKLSNVCSHIFRKNQKNFGVIHNTEEERGEIINKTLSQPYTESPPAAMKKAIRKRVSADAFSRRAFLSLRIFFLCRPFGTAVLLCRLSGCVSVVLGVSLSAAARSAAALVYDKLTPNSHLCYNQYAL